MEHREDPKERPDHRESTDDTRPEAPGSEHEDTFVDTSVEPEHGTGSEPEIPDGKD